MILKCIEIPFCLPIFLLYLVFYIALTKQNNRIGHIFSFLVWFDVCTRLCLMI